MFEKLITKLINFPHWCKLTLRYFIQRKKWGFDDTETWNLDLSFYEWLLPRLKRFTELTNSYDDSKNSFENWKKELEENIKKLELIIKYQFDEINFPANYPNKSPLNAYIENRQEFMEWFGKNINNLWW